MRHRAAAAVLRGRPAVPPLADRVHRPLRAARPEPPAALRLDASVAQFRFDEGTRNLKAGVTNDGDRDIRVTPGHHRLGRPSPSRPSRSPTTPVQPGQTAAFTIAYGAARCAARPSRADPVLVAVVTGAPLRLPLRVEDPGLLLRLHAKACAQQRARPRGRRCGCGSRRTPRGSRDGVPARPTSCCGAAAGATERGAGRRPGRQRAARPGARGTGRGALPGELPPGRGR